MKFTFLFSLVVTAITWDRLRQQGNQVADNIRHQANSVYKVTGNKVSELSKSLKSLFAKLRQKMPSAHKDGKSMDEEQQQEPTSEQVNEFFKQLQQKLQEIQAEKLSLSSKPSEPAKEEEKEKSKSESNDGEAPAKEVL